MLLRNAEYSLLLNCGGDIQRVPVSHLQYVEVYSHQFQYHTTEGNLVLTMTRTLRDLEEELQPHGFVRCHKGCLINLRYVEAVRGASVLVAGTELPVSRNRRKDLLDALLVYMKGGLVQ